MGQTPRLDQGDTGIAGARILILEDQADVAEQLAAAITEAGGEVIAVAETIDNALSIIRSETISAAVVTMSIGGVRAEAVARELLHREIPFAVTTGIGADGHHPGLHSALTITKPFQKGYVQAVLRKLLTAA